MSHTHSAHLDGLYGFMTKQLRNNERMVDRLAQRWARILLKQTLVDWKKIIIRKKYTRVLLEQTSGRWTKQRLQRLLKAWAEFTIAEKVHKTQEQLKHLRENAQAYQELLVRLEHQIESAKLESKTHREHVDFAKRQILQLEDLLAQLDSRVQQSNERKLQRIVNQWGELCFGFVDSQCAYLQNMLDAVAPDQFVDAAALVHKGEDLQDLLALPSDVLVLRWINFQLSQCVSMKKYYAASVAGFIQNFTTDMQSQYVLRHILQRILQIQRSKQLPASLISIRRSSTAKDILSKLGQRALSFSEIRGVLEEQLNPPCPVFLSSHVLENDVAGDLMFCLFSFLVCEHPNLNLAVDYRASIPSADSLCPWRDAQLALDDARAIWETIRSQWSELGTPFEIQENTKMTPDVTSPPQILVKANIAFQNAINTVQYACSKRSIVMKTWNCVQRKVQQDALRLLMHRARKEPPLELIDRRIWREKYMLTTLHIAKLVPILSREDPTSKDSLEAELQQIECILAECYQDLHNVYGFYASIDQETAGSNDSAPRTDSNNRQQTTQPRVESRDRDQDRFFSKISMSMSLVEFHRFLKDCRLFGSHQRFPYEFIQRVFEQVNVSVAATTESAILAAPSDLRIESEMIDVQQRGADDNPSEMTPAEFVEALVHIVHSPYVSLAAKGKPQPPTGHLTLSQRMRKCLQDVILPNAMQQHESVNIFRPMLKSAECREVFTKYQRKLHQLYLQFAALEGADVRPRSGSELGRHGAAPLHPAELKPAAPRRRKVLSVNGFVACCKHFDLIRENFLNLDDIQHVMAEILQMDRQSIPLTLGSAFETQGESNAANSPSSTSPSAVRNDASAELDRPRSTDELLLLTYAEFLEALAAVACYLCPDVFIPLATKLDEFFMEQLQFGLTR